MNIPGKKVTLETIRKPEVAFCAISLLSMAVVVLCMLASHGDLVEQYFFYDERDTAMDFFHSIEYVKGRMPYGLFDTLYPPLANVLFYILYLLIPKWISENWASTFETSVAMRATPNNLRTYQASMLLFLIFVIFSAYVMYIMADKLMGKDVISRKTVIFCALFSYGILYGFERGNIILLCWALMAFFVYFRNSENPFLREVSYLALAVAAGLKLYPAFLGILLIKERKVFPAIRTVMYGIGAVILPLYFFNEGLSGLWMWLKVVFGFGSSAQYPWVGNGFANILNHVGYVADHFLGTSYATQNYALVGVAAALLLLVCALFMNKEWETVLTIILSMMMFQSQADYIYGMYLLPLLLFIAQEKRLNRTNLLPFAIMTLFTVHVPLFHSKKAADFTPRNTLFQICIIILLVWCVVKALQYARNREKNLTGGQNEKVCRARLRTEAMATAAVFVVIMAGNIVGAQIWERVHNWGVDAVFNGGIGEEDNKSFTVQDEQTNETLQVQWCTDATYFAIYNHAPFAQTFRISFKTGYGMDLSQPHSMYFTTETGSTRVVLDENTRDIVYEVSVEPGTTRVGISYLGPKVTTENHKGEELKMSFTAADFQVQVVTEE